MGPSLGLPIEFLVRNVFNIKILSRLNHFFYIKGIQTLITIFEFNYRNVLNVFKLAEVSSNKSCVENDCDIYKHQHKLPSE